MKKVIIVVALMFPCLAFAKISMDKAEERFFLGADLTQRWGDFEQSKGNNVLKKNQPNANFFVGYDFCDHLGVELGYESTTKKNRSATLSNPHEANGVVVNNKIRYETKLKISGWHASLIGKLKVKEFTNTKLATSLFIKVGLKRAQFVVSEKLYGAGALVDSSAGDHKKTKTIAKLSTGLEHFFNPNVGVRAIVGWENSKRLKLTGKRTSGLESRIALKDATFAGLGIVVRPYAK